MPHPAPHLGIQSWCFRAFNTTPALIEQVQNLGLRHLELCGVHANFNEESTFEPLLLQFQQANIQITSIGVQTFTGDAATEEKWFRFCKLAAAKMISATFAIDAVPHAYRIAEKLADKYDIAIAIHNHGGYDWLGNAAMLGHVFKNTSPRIGLCLDTAWCMQAGENPLQWAERFHDRLVGTHLKDFTFLPTGQWRDVVIGTGNLQLHAYLALLANAPRLQTLTLEYEGDVENPNPNLIKCIGQFQKATSTTPLSPRLAGGSPTQLP